MTKKNLIHNSDDDYQSTNCLNVHPLIKMPRENSVELIIRDVETHNAMWIIDLPLKVKKLSSKEGVNWKSNIWKTYWSEFRRKRAFLSSVFLASILDQWTNFFRPSRLIINLHNITSIFYYTSCSKSRLRQNVFSYGCSKRRTYKTGTRFTPNMYVYILVDKIEHEN